MKFDVTVKAGHITAFDKDGKTQYVPKDITFYGMSEEELHMICEICQKHLGKYVYPEISAELIMKEEDEE